MNDRMKGLCRRLMRCGLEPDQVTVKVADRRAGPARDILRESESAYDLVVVGRRGLGAVRGLVLGSVTNKLVTGMSTCPMWVVGKHARPGSVLVALDGSEFSWRGLEHLTQEYIARDRDVWLFTTQRMSDEMSLDSLIVGGTKLNSVLELGRERLEQAGINPDRIHSQLMEGVTSRALAIVEKARREKCDTIIMGRWGVTHNAQFPLGRVTAKVLQLSRGLSVWIVN
jgi:nucleotide-binding universal stress UspA family protein